MRANSKPERNSHVNMLQARLSIIDLLLIGLDKPAPSLSHFLLGFDLKKQPSVGVPGVARSGWPDLNKPSKYLFEKSHICYTMFFARCQVDPARPGRGSGGRPHPAARRPRDPSPGGRRGQPGGLAHFSTEALRGGLQVCNCIQSGASTCSLSFLLQAMAMAKMALSKIRHRSTF